MVVAWSRAHASEASHGRLVAKLTQTERYRLPALAWHLERLYGKKVPQCLNCGSLDLWENYARASFQCRDCGKELSPHFGVRFVPADVNARNPDEEHLPEGIWAKRLRSARP